MDFNVLLTCVNSIIYAVDTEYNITFISPAIYNLTGASPDDIIGTKCYRTVVGLTAPCKDCPVSIDKETGSLYHEVISKNGELFIYHAEIVKNVDLYIETLCDITAIKKEIDFYRHETKRLKALQVTESIKGREVINSYRFVKNILNNINYGVMATDQDFKIIISNEPFRNHLENGELPEFCYMVYGLDAPCTDCPHTTKLYGKSNKKIGERNVTVTFKPSQNYIVETVRDTTKELNLINRISTYHEEIQEKQRQMQLLNKDLLKMNDKLKAAQTVINEELKQVGEIQQSLLPEELPVIDGYEFGSFYTPAEHAGGDYYDCIQMSNGFWGFTVADVSGHGTPAAVIMAMSRAIMRSYTYDVISPSEALYMVNEILCDNVHTKDFVTMFYMVLDSTNANVRYSSAGHNPILHFDKSEMIVRPLNTEGLFLATFSGMDYAEKSLQLESGDILFLYTDGLVEAMNAKRQMYGLDSVISRLMMYHDADCDRIIQEIMDDVKDFTENLPFDDDVTIFAIKKL